jgi:phosphatidylglycerophosphate synthase
VGQRQNPDGMRSLIHYGVAYALLALALNVGLVGSRGFLYFFLVAAAHLIWISSLLTLLVFNVGFLETLDGKPLRHLNGANIVTLGRLFFLPTMAYLIVQGARPAAGLVYLFLALTDVLDGLWARWRGQITKLGIVLDPLVDVAFHVWAFVALWFAEMLPTWILSLVLIRYGLLVGGGIVLYLAKGQIRVLPTPLGKLTGILTTTLCAYLLLWPHRFPGWGYQLLGGILAVTILHVVAIGWVNIRRPLVAPPAPAQVRGRWARTLLREDERDDGEA